MAILKIEKMIEDKQKLVDFAKLNYNNCLNFKYFPGKSKYDFLAIAGLNRIFSQGMKVQNKKKAY